MGAGAEPGGDRGSADFGDFGGGEGGAFRRIAGGKRLTEVWARLHVATGLPRGEFEELSPADLLALVRALEAAEERAARRDARLYALLCNLKPVGKKTCKEEDFLKKTAAPPESEEARQAIEAYRAWVGEGRG